MCGPTRCSYPGLVVLHDTHLHHARAAFLLSERRASRLPRRVPVEPSGRCPPTRRSWRSPASTAGSITTGRWCGPWSRRRGWSRCTAKARARNCSRTRTRGARRDARGARRHRIVVRSAWATDGWCTAPDGSGGARDACARSLRHSGGRGRCSAVFGGLTPEKRLPQILAAFRATLPHAPGAHLLLAGAPAAHYDIAADDRRAWTCRTGSRSPAISTPTRA